MKYLRYVYIIIFITIFLLFINFSLELKIVEGLSMEPTFYKGDIIVIDKLYYKIPFISSRKNIYIDDIIVFKINGNYSIKRCVANWNSTYKIKNKKLFINDKIFDIDEKKIYLFNSFTNIPKNDIFVIGDNLSNSNDSRFFGFIKSDDIIGRVIFKL